MKKKWIGGPPLWRKDLKLMLKAMRLIGLLVFAGTMAVSASSYSQRTKIDLRVQNVSVSDILQTIEKNTKFIFIYDAGLIETIEPRTISVRSQTVETILDELFRDTGVGYYIDDRQVFLYQKEEMPVLDPVGVQVVTEQPQKKEISGTVKDEKGIPLPGVSVVLKGTTTGTVTNAGGNFTFQVPLDARTLVFSFVGMKTQEIQIGNKTVIHLVLAEETMGIEEVVAVGYGVQRKATLTGSVTSVDSKFIESRPLTNTSQALQGLNGLYVNQTGGQPGNDNATIRIRGVGTFNDNDPLVLVDGIEYSLRDVNPNDIESISVLKDAASAAIYGNRAANGVILITTKQGNEGKLKVELNSYFGLQQATYLPDVVTNSYDWMNSRNQAAINDGQPALYSDALLEEWKNGTDPDKYPNTDWNDILFSLAPTQDHSLRLSGGSKNVTFSTSLGYLDQDGILMGTEAKRYSLNSKMVYKYSDKLKFGANIIGSYWYDREPNGGMYNFMANCVTRILPVVPNILSNGRYGDKWISVPGFNTLWHPVATAKETYQKTNSQRVMIQLNGEYTFPFDVKYNVDFSVNKYDVNVYKWQPEVYVYKGNDPDGTGVLNGGSPKERHVYRGNNNNLSTTFFQTLSWNKIIADRHNVNILLGFSREAFYNSNFNAYIEGFLGNELTELNAGTINKDVGGTSTEARLMSYFGRAGYNFSDKYLVEMNFRYDGSSRFGKGHKWGFFPSFSAGWRISQEPFMKEISAIDDLKLRVSVGQLGNQNIGLYAFLNNINLSQGVTFNDGIYAGSAVTTLSDPDISWEKTTMTNIGLDAILWNGSMEVNVDVFDKYTSDILARINIPDQVGNLTGPVTNLYDMSNKGIEISVSHRKSTGSLTYKVEGQIGFVKNNVEDMNGDEKYTTNRFGTIRVIKVGYPINSWYGYQAEGIFKTPEEVDNHVFQHASTSPGDIKYRDVNKDEVLDINDMGIMGRSTPKFTYGFNLNFGYKSFDLDAIFQGVQGINIYPWENLAFGNYNGAGITKDMYYNSWTPDKPDAKYPRLFEPIRGPGINSLNSTFWLQDASYLRLKNLQLSYTVSSSLLNKINISSLKVYINAQNLLTFSPYKLTDPEQDILAEDIKQYPGTKIYTMGFNVTF